MSEEGGKEIDPKEIEQNPTYLIAPEDYVHIYCKNQRPAQTPSHQESQQAKTQNISGSREQKNRNNSLKGKKSKKKKSKEKKKKKHKSKKREKTKKSKMNKAPAGLNDTLESNRRAGGSSKQRKKRTTPHAMHGAVKHRTPVQAQQQQPQQQQQQQQHQPQRQGSPEPAATPTQQALMQRQLLQHQQPPPQQQQQQQQQQPNQNELELPTYMIAPEDYIHLYKGSHGSIDKANRTTTGASGTANAKPESNNPKNQIDELPTAMIAPEDYIHIYKKSQ